MGLLRRIQRPHHRPEDLWPSATLELQRKFGSEPERVVAAAMELFGHD